MSKESRNNVWKRKPLSRSRVMKAYFANNAYSVSMGLYSARLKQALEQLFPDWECKELSPSGTQLIDQPNKYIRYLKDFIVYPLYFKILIDHTAFDVFHITDHTYAYLIDSLPKEKTIITCHDLMILKIAAGEIDFGLNRVAFPAALIKRNVSRVKKIDQAAFLIAVSYQTKQDMVNLLGITGDRIQVIYSGLNYSFSPLCQNEKDKIKTALGLSGKRIILCVGNCQSYKNIEGVIEASFINKEYYRNNDVKLIKVGQEFTDSQKRLINKYGMQSYFIYLGYINSFADLNGLYNIADLFLFPSLYEGFGWPPLEAMACGTPVVASQAGSLKEVLLDAAFTVDPRNHEQIAQAIRTVLEDETLRGQLIKKGIANIARFDWKHTAIEYARLYNKIFEMNCERGR